MARTRTRFVRGPGVRRKTFWARSAPDAANTTLAAALAVLDSTFTPDNEGDTLIRTRGMITVMSDAPLMGTEDFVGAVGMCVVSAQAAAIGITAILTPYTDADSELWAVHQYFTYRQIFFTAASFSHNVGAVFEFDSKAMRKVDEGSVLAIVVENGSAANGMLYFLNFSTLFKD